MAGTVQKELASTCAVTEAKRKKGSPYNKTITAIQKVKIARYAAENDIVAALQHFKTNQCLELKESTVRGWKKTYCDDLISQKRKGDMKLVDQLPVHSLGRPLELGLDVESSAKKMIHQIREAGGTVNNSVVIGSITGILCDTDSNLLTENEGSINVGKETAHCLLGRMQFVKRQQNPK